MTERFILDQYGNTLRTVRYDPARPEDGMTWVAEQECDNIVEACAIDAETPQTKGHMRHAARIPLEVINRAAREGWLHDRAAWKRWVNDPENRRFRTWQGTV